MTDFGIKEALRELGLKDINNGTSTGSNNFSNGEIIESFSPVDGKLIGKVIASSKEDYEKVMLSATKAYQSFRNIPAPQRGEIVRQFGNKLRALKEPLGKLVSYEMGKSLQEGYGEVQEMIDICDFAVGLSRQLNGQTIPSERPGHVMRENGILLELLELSQHLTSLLQFGLGIRHWLGYVAMYVFGKDLKKHLFVQLLVKILLPKF